MWGQAPPQGGREGPTPPFRGGLGGFVFLGGTP